MRANRDRAPSRPSLKSIRSRMSLWPWPIAPAVFNLDHPARYVHWHFFQMSVANVVVILLMIAVFVAAILLPFPSRNRRPS
jgi:hypothetical protein